MGRSLIMAVVAFGLIVTAAPGYAAGPGEFLQRLLIDPGTAFSGGQDSPAQKKATRPSVAPATAPMPRLRPAVAAATAIPSPAAAAPEITAPEITPEPAAPKPATTEPAVPDPVTLAAAPSAEDAAASPLLRYQPAGETPAGTAMVDEPPLPHLRPLDATEAVNDVAVHAASALGSRGTIIASLPAEPMPELTRPPPAATATCGVALASLGVTLAPLAPIEEGECGIAQPVAVSSLDGGTIEFTAKAIIGCDSAEIVANWVRKNVQPAAERTFGKPLTGLRIAASYACRNRDNLPDAKLSEHARGNAIDISGFRIGDRWIEVQSGWAAGGKDTAFLKTVRKSACGPFTTVLGPGSDSFHTDHFHLDTIRRGKHGRALYCR